MQHSICFYISHINNVFFICVFFSILNFGFLTKGFVPADQYQCNMPCSGDSNEICGGSYRMNVYKLELYTIVDARFNYYMILPTSLYF